MVLFIFLFFSRFKAEVYVNDGLVAEAYALNKKDAKKDAAVLAIQKMCPQHLVRIY